MGYGQSWSGRRDFAEHDSVETVLRLLRDNGSTVARDW